MVLGIKSTERSFGVGKLVGIDLTTSQKKCERASIWAGSPGRCPLIQVNRFIQKTGAPVELCRFLDDADVCRVIGCQFVDDPHRSVDLSVTFEERSLLQAVHHRFPLIARGRYQSTDYLLLVFGSENRAEQVSN